MSFGIEKNFSKGSFNFVDGDDQVINGVEIDENQQSQLTYTFKPEDVGIKTFKGRYTGDNTYAPAVSDEFTVQVVDPNGNGGANGQNPYVTQIVAGPGIYISAPNGKGIVTISTQPIDASINTQPLLDIAWSKSFGSTPTGVVPQFIAVGNTGTNIRSRDGDNWTKMKGTTVDINSVCAVVSDTIPDNGMEYIGVADQGQVIYGRAGADGDAMSRLGTLRDNNGTITENLTTISAFPNAGDPDTSSAASTTTTIVADYAVLTYNFFDGSDLDTRTYITSPSYGQNSVYEYLGWSQQSKWPTTTPIIEWGGDNTGIGVESIKINLSTYKQVNSSTNLVISCNAFWYGRQGYQPVKMTAALYRGGSLSEYNYTWINSGAQQTNNIESAGVTVTRRSTESTELGQHIATFTYNPVTNTGSFS
jgi:hypothetical protein